MDVRIIMISGVVYLLRIFKMFHGLMNNPVLSNTTAALKSKCRTKAAISLRYGKVKVKVTRNRTRWPKGFRVV